MERYDRVNYNVYALSSGLLHRKWILHATLDWNRQRLRVRHQSIEIYWLHQDNIILSIRFSRPPLDFSFDATFFLVSWSDHKHLVNHIKMSNESICISLAFDVKHKILRMITYVALRKSYEYTWPSCSDKTTRDTRRTFLYRLLCQFTIAHINRTTILFSRAHLRHSFFVSFLS